MSSYDQIREGNVNVEELADLPSKEQADKIADNFASVSNEYQALQTDEINIDEAENTTPCPVLEQHQVYEFLKHIKTNTATVKEFACELAAPVTHLIISCVMEGVYRNIFKIEIVTPVPKVYPSKSVNDLRKILA